MAYRAGTNRIDVGGVTKIVHHSDIENQADVISLADLWTELVKRKIAILSVTLITTMVATLYVFFATPVYKVEMGFLPPAESDIQAFNIYDEQNVNVDYVYSTFKRNLMSLAPRQAVFEKMRLYERLSQFHTDKSTKYVFKEFNKNLTIKFPRTIGDVQNPTVTLVLKGEDPESIIEIITQFADEASRITNAEIITNIKSELSARKNNLKNEIELLIIKAEKHRLDEIMRLEAKDSMDRKMIEDQIKTLRIEAEQNRLDKIVKLESAAIIARSLGFEHPFRRNSESKKKHSQIMFDLSMEDVPLYFFGYKAIEAELKSLKSIENDDAYTSNLRQLQSRLILLNHNRKVEQLKKRKNDEPFVDVLRDKQSDYRRLQLIQIDPVKAKTARIDQVVTPTEAGDWIWPKRKLIISLGLVLGLMLGVFGVFFSMLFKNPQNNVSALTDGNEK